MQPTNYGYVKSVTDEEVRIKVYGDHNIGLVLSYFPTKEDDLSPGDKVRFDIDSVETLVENDRVLTSMVAVNIQKHGSFNSGEGIVSLVSLPKNPNRESFPEISVFSTGLFKGFQYCVECPDKCDFHPNDKVTFDLEIEENNGRRSLKMINLKKIKKAGA